MRKIVVADHSGSVVEFTTIVDVKAIEGAFRALRKDFRDGKWLLKKYRRAPVSCSYPYKPRGEKEWKTRTVEIKKESQINDLKARLTRPKRGLKHLKCTSDGETSPTVTMTPIRRGEDKGKYHLAAWGDCQEPLSLSEWLCRGR